MKALLIALLCALALAGSCINCFHIIDDSRFYTSHGKDYMMEYMEGLCEYTDGGWTDACNYMKNYGMENVVDLMMNGTSAMEICTIIGNCPYN
ncbi:hypothetical protein ENUP19_0144G0007 [Entamoeba nuttalli]|uniref:Saposin B-type domain-containing protein n=1 Tax=Entamoeba nuttalli TaxID=412467 RepID=A0ABQ0DKM5_9EUKA